MARKISLNTKTVINPMIYAYTTPEIKRHDGWTKIGYTEQEVKKRLEEQTHTADVEYKLEWHKPALYDNGEYFRDSDFHAYLVKNGIERSKEKNNEWFHILPQPAKNMLYDFKENRGVLSTGDVIDYTLRDEQDEAAGKAADYFSRHEKGQFLFNAKPRFGKTLTTYDLVKRMNATNVLIVTNRPAIANSWYDDYVKFLGTQSGYHFVSTVDSIENKPYVVSREKYQKLKNESLFSAFTGCIEFVSLQDLKGSIYFGGKFDKLKEVAEENWDLLVIDEAHEGVDTYKTDVAFDHIKAKFKLHLSGTPFKALANDKFSQDAIYNWTYADEQKKKREYVPEPGSDNPYAKLPQLNMFTYQLSEMVDAEVSAGINIDGENREYAFDLNEFFSTKGNGSFKYDEEVDNFLDALTTQEKFPFSTPELRDELKHTLWLLNRVSSAKALYNKLKKHPVFKDYEIVLAAGDGRVDIEEDTVIEDKEIKKAFDKVTSAISRFDKTITISVGQLTTGVTIPEWTAVLMLSSLKSPALYMQAAFRAQNPCTFRIGKTQYRKENAYVFDFDPARTLSIFEQIANGLSGDTSGDKGDSDTRKRHVRELLNFFPVIGEDEEGEMIELDAEKVLSIPRKLKSVEVVKRGFMSDYLFQNIGHIFNAPSTVQEMISKLQAFKEPELPDTEDLQLDENGDVIIDAEKVVGTAADKFGEKIYDKEQLESDLLDIISDEEEKAEEEKSKSEEQRHLDLLLDKFNTGIVQPALETADKEYGEELSASEKKKLARNIKAQSETAVKKLFGEHEIQKKIIEKERNERLEEVSTKAEIERINKECDEKKEEAKKGLEKALTEAVSPLMKDIGETIVLAVETSKKEKQKEEINSYIKDHLRGFTRTIPSFLMAYGDENTRLSTFEKNIPDNVFIDVTTLEKREFILLRDGGNVPNKETGKDEPFEGHIFDEVVFDDSVKEFLKKKEDLANYFDEKSREDIFNYIPPQKNNQIFTPRQVVKNMVDMLEKENPGCFDDPDKSFADLYMKSGMYLAEIVTRLYRSGKMKSLYPDNKERLNHIFSKQVYGCAPTEIIYRICISYLLGFSDDIKIDKHNIKLCDTLELAKKGNLEEELLKLFDISDADTVEKTQKDNGMWRCPKCDKLNEGYRTKCKRCGMRKFLLK